MQKSKLESKEVQNVYNSFQMDEKDVESLQKKVYSGDLRDVSVEAQRREVEEQMKDLDKILMDKYSNWPKGLVKALRTLRIMPNSEKEIGNRVREYSVELEHLKRKSNQQEECLENITNKKYDAEDKKTAAATLVKVYDAMENKLVEYNEDINGKILTLQKNGSLPDRDLVEEQKKVRQDLDKAKTLKAEYAKEYLKQSNAKNSLENIYFKEREKTDKLNSIIHNGELLLDTINVVKQNSNGTDDYLGVFKTIEAEAEKGKGLEKILGKLWDVYDISIEGEPRAYNLGVSEDDKHNYQKKNSQLVDVAMQQIEEEYGMS